MKNNIKIATRGSKLALYQANKVKSELETKFPELTIELNIIKTKGDKILDVALSKIGDKGLFTKELEVSLLENESDLAVHSLKDMPTVLPEGLVLGGVLARGEFRDALVHNTGKKLTQLDETDIVATSSLRRKAQLLAINPNLKIVDIRGNVDTRLQKMADGYCTSMIMAGAGLIRLGYDKHITEIIDENVMIPAVSQGAIAIEIRKGDSFIQSLIDKICCAETLQTVKAERVFLNALEGGCQVPIGCYSKVEGDQYTITGFMADLDGKNMMKDKVTDKLEHAEQSARRLADKFYEKGADKIIEKIRQIPL